MFRPLITLAALIAFLILPLYLGYGQSSEHESVEHLAPADVGPYEPEQEADLDMAAQEIIDQTNQFRKREGRKAVSRNETLQKTADSFARYMAETDDYGHRADGRTPSQRAKAKGYEFCVVAENIAYQFKTTGFKTDTLAKRFVEGWENSPGHRRNMLDTDVTETGVAIAQSKTTGVYYAVQLFGRPKSAQIAFRIINKTEVEFQYQIADQSFSLPPRYARKHQLCRAEKLHWRPQLNADANKQEPSELTPEDGAVFQVQTQEEKILLEAVTAEKPSNS